MKWLLKNIFTTSFNGYTYANVEKLQIDMFYKLAEIGVEVIDEPGRMILKNKNKDLIFGEVIEVAGQNHSLALVETIKEFKEIEIANSGRFGFTEKTGKFFYAYHKRVYPSSVYSKSKTYDITKIKLVTPRFQLKLNRDKINDIDVVEAFKLITTLLLYNSDKERNLIEGII